MATYIVLLLVLKLFLKNNLYSYILGILNFSFIFIAFPNKYHFLFFIVYSYFITFLFSDHSMFNKKLPAIALLIIPLLATKIGETSSSGAFAYLHIFYFAGLSFVTFRSVSYIMDKASDRPITNFISYFNYLSFTPTLLIGPIDRFSNFLKSEKNGFTNMNSENFITGWNFFVKGIAFKYIFAEVIDRYWLNNFSTQDPSLLAVSNTMYSYYFYLFFDFAGYSFMAMGIGKMMGIDVPLNFKNPFIAKNPQEFWESFHISLGNWLKDYFFKPINLFFGRKKSLKNYPLVRQNTALFLTFFLMGCWNGLEKHYILSGMLFGTYSFVHNTYRAQCNKKGRDIIFGNMNPTLVKIISIVIMFNLVAFAMYIFSGKYPHSFSFHF